MDLSEEVRATNKRAFLKFFDQSVIFSSQTCDQKNRLFLCNVNSWIDLFQELSIELKKDINTMINRQERRLIIKLSHLYNHREGAALARRFLYSQMPFLPLSILPSFLYFQFHFVFSLSFEIFKMPL